MKVWLDFPPTGAKCENRIHRWRIAIKRSRLPQRVCRVHSKAHRRTVVREPEPRHEDLRRTGKVTPAQSLSLTAANNFALDPVKTTLQAESLGTASRQCRVWPDMRKVAL